VEGYRAMAKMFMRVNCDLTHFSTFAMPVITDDLKAAKLVDKMLYL
jgi:hypothetical protein